MFVMRDVAVGRTIHLGSVADGEEGRPRLGPSMGYIVLKICTMTLALKPRPDSA